MPAKRPGNWDHGKRGMGFKDKTQAQRTYTDQQVANTLNLLDANQGNVAKTSRETGIPSSTINAWANNGRRAAASTLRDKTKHDMCEAMQLVCWDLLESIPGKIPASNVSQAATAFGILVDKRQLLSGKPTGINANLNQNINANFDLSRLTSDELATYRSHAESLRALLERSRVPGGNGTPDQDRGGQAEAPRLSSPGVADPGTRQDPPMGMVS